MNRQPEGELSPPRTTVELARVWRSQSGNQACCDVLAPAFDCVVSTAGGRFGRISTRIYVADVEQGKVAMGSRVRECLWTATAQCPGRASDIHDQFVSLLVQFGGSKRTLGRVLDVAEFKMRRAGYDCRRGVVRLRRGKDERAATAIQMMLECGSRARS